MARTDDDAETRELASEDDAAAADGRQSLASRGCGLIGCALIIAVLVALGAGALALGDALEPIADRFLWAPHDVVREYLDAYEEGNMERARGFVCSDRGEGRPPDPGSPADARSWTAFVEDEFPYPRAGGRVAIYYGLNVPGRTTPMRFQALVQREDEGWRICAFE